MSDTPITDAEEARQRAVYESERECGYPPFTADFDFARKMETAMRETAAPDEWLKEFGEAVKRLDELYPDEQFALEIGARREIMSERFVARVGHSDTCKYGYGSTPMRAVENLVLRAGTGEARRTMVALELRNEAAEKLALAAQLEAQSV